MWHCPLARPLPGQLCPLQQNQDPMCHYIQCIHTATSTYTVLTLTMPSEWQFSGWSRFAKDTKHHPVVQGWGKPNLTFSQLARLIHHAVTTKQATQQGGVEKFHTSYSPLPVWQRDVTSPEGTGALPLPQVPCIPPSQHRDWQNFDIHALVSIHIF